MRLFAAILAIVMLWLAGDPSAQNKSGRRGIVRGGGHAFVDDGGPFLARGASLLWGLWGYQHDRERLAKNLAQLRDWGFDYIRVLGVVGAPGERPGPVCGSGVEGCDSWRDRRADPTAARYTEDIAGFSDYAFKQYGLRTQWTIFGGTEFAPTPAARKAVVERFGEMAVARREAIFAFEIANESWQNGFPGEEGRAELRTLAALLKSRTSNLVALSSPEGGSCDGARALHQNSVADLATLHIGRVGAQDGEHWRALRDIWELHRCQGIPALRSSNEPIGPESSVASMDDPVALAAMAFVTYGSGIGAFVFHSGPGIRGGGGADAQRGRHRNLWELPASARIASGLGAIARFVPGDLPNWQKRDVTPNAQDRLFDLKDPAAAEGIYCFSKAQEFACTVVGIKKPFALVARQPVRAAVHQFLSSSAAASARVVVAGGSLSIPVSGGAVLIRGRLQL